jgi:hypothetical protein
MRRQRSAGLRLLLTLPRWTPKCPPRRIGLSSLRAPPDSHDQLSPAHLEKHQPPSASVSPCYLRDSGGFSAPTVAAHGA